MNETTTNSIAGTVKQLLTSPSRFYSSMPKSGGFGEPLIFILAMAVVAALICALGAIPGQGIVAAFKILIGKSILWSIYAVIGAFVASVAFFFIWKVLGSLCSYETAFRCTAYAMVMLPVTLLLSLVPVVGTAAGLFWTAWLLVTASTATHGLQQGKPLIIFGLLALLGIWRIASCDCGDDNALSVGESAEGTAASVTELEPVKVVVTAESSPSVSGDEVAADVQQNAENAGRALGELVKGVTDMAKNVGEDIAKGLDSTLQQALPATEDTKQAQSSQQATEETASSTGAATSEPAFSIESASESVGETVGAIVKSLGNVARDASAGLQKALDSDEATATGESPKGAGDNAAGRADSPATAGSSVQAATPAMTPEQLGEALGTFINQLNAAANSAAKGFERGRQDSGDASLNYEETPAQDAGEALGRFMRSFNDAVRELEAQTPEAEPER